MTEPRKLVFRLHAFNNIWWYGRKERKYDIYTLIKPHIQHRQRLTNHTEDDLTSGKTDW